MVRNIIPTRNNYRAGLFLALAVILIGSAYSLAVQLPQATGRGLYSGYPIKLRLDYAKLQKQVQDLTDTQAKADRTLVTDQILQADLSAIQLDAAAGRYRSAESAIQRLAAQIKTWRIAIMNPKNAGGGVPPADVVSMNTPGSIFIPILIYHYTPTDFDTQLTQLELKGYTVVGLEAVAAAMSGGPSLPAKPAVITYDDGFENQMSAFHILQHHHMKATFYIINGGEASRWCIGAGRRYGDPLQPASGCGDAYMTWDQVRELDRSGLITIGGHTLDHPQLASLSSDAQRHEILDSKIAIEAELGHPIYDFAYPYGNYNQTTISLVMAAGYRTAVTTIAGSYQPPGSLYTLRRVRSTLDLP
jgi:peptidoglycan/xylan/chitin deacetylase (PgdA/CDA1 family)